MLLPIGAIKELTAVEDCILIVKFYDGVTKRVDMKPLADEGGVFERLKNPGFFKQAKIGSGGVIWDDELDIAQEYLYDHGIPIEEPNQKDRP